MKSKKQLILWVLNILNNESDETRPLTQTQIAERISDCYPCDRKTVCRNIKFLKDMGYPIIKIGRGFYMDRKMFTVDEVDFVRDAILNASGKDTAEKEKLAESVAHLLAKTYMRR